MTIRHGKYGEIITETEAEENQVEKLGSTKDRNKDVEKNYIAAKLIIKKIKDSLKSKFNDRRECQVFTIFNTYHLQSGGINMGTTDDIDSSIPSGFRIEYSGSIDVATIKSKYPPTMKEIKDTILKSIKSKMVFLQFQIAYEKIASLGIHIRKKYENSYITSNSFWMKIHIVYNNDEIDNEP